MKWHIISALLMLNTALFAQEANLQKSSCKIDIKNFCSTQKPGLGLILKCLIEHEKEITPDCSKILSTAKKKMEEKVKQAHKSKGNLQKSSCESEIKKFCSTQKNDQGLILKCLIEHEKEISPTCNTVMLSAKKKMNEKIKKVQEYCKADIYKLCDEEAAGGKMRCLESKKSKVSAKCKKAL